MPVSDFSSIREEVRRAIRDTAGLLWSDAGLDRVINEAQREYAIRSGALRGSAEVTAGDSPVFAAPDDFIEPVRFIGNDGLERPFFSWKYLHDRYPDFREIAGTEPRGVVTDFDGEGKLRLFPRIPEGSPAGTLFYRRLPRRDQLETENVDAVIQYCLFLVFLLDDHRSAATYYGQFAAAVARENSRQRGLKAHGAVRHGRFF